MYFILLGILSVLFGLFAWHHFKGALILLTGLLPIYLLRLAIGPFPTTLLEIFIVILAIIWLIQKRPDWKRITSLPWLPPAILLTVAAILGTIISPDTIGALGIFKAYFIEPILLAMIFATTLSKKEWPKVFQALGVSAAILSLFGILQYATGLGIPTPWDIELRITSLFDYPNALGLFLAPVMSYGIMRFLQNKQRAFWTGITSISFIAILLAQTEAALVAIPATLLISIWFTSASNKIKTAFTASGLIIASLLFAFVPTVREKLFLQDYSGQVRMSQWTETWQLIQSQPVFGAGLSGYTLALEPFHDPSLYEIFQYPHNLFLNIWAEMGVLGLIAFFWLTWLVLKRLSITQSLDLMTPALFAALLTMTIHGLVDVPYFKNDLSVMTWIFLAAFFATHLAAKSPHSNK